MDEHLSYKSYSIRIYPPICGQHRLDDAGNTMNITIETITECVVIKVS